MIHEIFQLGEKDESSGEVMPDIESVIPTERKPEIPSNVVDGALDRLRKEEESEKARRKQIEEMQRPKTLH